MAADFQAKNWKGFAHWMRVQAGEEQGHAMKFAKYIEERLGRVTLREIAAPPAEWATPLAAFEAGQEHEAKVTGLINKLVNLAAAEKDNATSILLQWFVTEQVEEEANADDIVQKLRLIKESVHGLFMLELNPGPAKVGRPVSRTTRERKRGQLLLERPPAGSAPRPRTSNGVSVPRPEKSPPLPLRERGRATGEKVLKPGPVAGGLVSEEPKTRTDMEGPRRSFFEGPPGIRVQKESSRSGRSVRISAGNWLTP